MRVFITGLAVLGPAGKDAEELFRSLEQGRRPLRPLSLFTTHGAAPRLVGQLDDFTHGAELPRTHALARVAAAQLSGALTAPPDAVVLGGTTGGMPLSEELLEAGEQDPARYGLHGTGSVALDLARELGCAGHALTVSTACSSGAVALKVGLELIRRGLCRTVLAGGVDALCRLTYHGFRMLKLIDAQGARPLDRDRRGMSVGEAAALLLLRGAEQPPEGALAELRGVGASCDAFHATRPLPDGGGARAAMERALADAGLGADDVDYINLHGTGTAGNDASEAAAVRSLYGEADIPPLSSIKGITGHPLAAAGALEAAAATLCLERGLLPGNVGLEHLDPDLGITPLHVSREDRPGAILSNSFGFGGNNASVLLTQPDYPAPAPAPGISTDLTLEVLAAQCISAVGWTDETLAALVAGRSARGSIPAAALKQGLPPRLIRRLKRLPRMALALAGKLLEGQENQDEPLLPRSIYFATGWGPLSETHDFLVELFASPDDLSSPTDFVGSVHNAPAGQLAMRHGARGINLTATGGVSSLEQALFMAALTATSEDEPLLLLGADEFHPRLTPLLDPGSGEEAAEGAGALLLRRPGPTPTGDEIYIRPLHLGLTGAPLGQGIWGVPAPAVALAGQENEQLQGLCRCVGYSGKVLAHGTTLGAHASASAQAIALAVKMVQQGRYPSVLLLTPGEVMAATAVWRGACP